MKLSIFGCLDRLRHGSKDSFVSGAFSAMICPFCRLWRVAFESPDCFRKKIGSAP